MKKKRFKYLLLFLLLLIIEVIIALYIKDNFIRPYIGDVLAVVVIYCFLRVVFPENFKLMPLYLFLFALFAEFMQYFNIVKILGLGNNRLISTLLGATFDWKDILCYAAGALLIFLAEAIFERKRTHDFSI